MWVGMSHGRYVGGRNVEAPAERASGLLLASACTEHSHRILQTFISYLRSNQTIRVDIIIKNCFWRKNSRYSFCIIFLPDCLYHTKFWWHCLFELSHLQVVLNTTYKSPKMPTPWCLFPEHQVRTSLACPTPSSCSRTRRWTSSAALSPSSRPMTRCQRSLLGFKNDHIDYHFRVLLSLYLRGVFT